MVVYKGDFMEIKTKKVAIILVMLFSVVVVLGVNPTINATEEKQEEVIVKSEDGNLSSETFNDIFKDVNMGIVVAENLGKKPNDVVTQEELNSISYLQGNNRNIENISGIERLENVYSIFLSGNKIKNLSPFLLNDFVNLDGLYLEDNEIEDISPLSRIVSMRQLFLHGNHIVDPTVAETFTSEVNNSGGYHLYSFYATGQTVTLNAKQAENFVRKNPTYSTNPEGETHYAVDISNNGIYNEALNQVEWSELDENVTQLTYEYVMTHMTQGGTWNYMAKITINLEPAVVRVSYVDENKNTLEEVAVFHGMVNTPYTVETKAIAGFELQSIVGNSKGQFTEEDQDIICVYAPLKNEDIGTIDEIVEIKTKVVRSQLLATGGFF